MPRHNRVTSKGPEVLDISFCVRIFRILTGLLLISTSGPFCLDQLMILFRMLREDFCLSANLCSTGKPLTNTEVLYICLDLDLVDLAAARAVVHL